MVVDQFFTPAEIATSSLLGLQNKGIKVVADFAIGDGSLVRALPFEPKTVLGLDLDSKVINRLRRESLGWELKTGNFIEPNSKTKKWLSQWEKKVDLIIMNPPFSCKGGKRYNVLFEENELKCRTALAFIVQSLKFLKNNGKLIAILPLSCFKSEADAIVFKVLQQYWHIEFGERFDKKSFEGCCPHSITIQFRRRETVIAYGTSDNSNDARPTIEILRGSTQMHKTLSQGKFAIIHSTNLKNGNLDKTKSYFTNRKVRFAKGVYLCIQRVGLPNLNKIILVNNERIHVLSDCVIALRGKSTEETEIIYQLVKEKWLDFKKLYDSTCAPYITLNQLANFLQTEGFNSETVEAFEPHRHHVIETNIFQPALAI